ncbi:MAG: glucosiduronase [Acidobacteria bacterium]|nr:glucosiduronase [Acidobacteriota bacterium]
MRTRLLVRATVVCFFAAIFAIGTRAEDGHEGWLRYAPLDSGVAKIYAIVPHVVIVEGDSAVLRSATQELSRGIRGMLGVALATQTQSASPSTAHAPTIVLTVDKNLAPESFRIRWSNAAGDKSLRITGGDDRGVLYGVFALLSKIARQESFANIDETQKPSAPVRWVNDWDNLDGSIERGYGGRSIFFDADNVRTDLSRVNEYARLLASIGINGCAINNVNANPRVLTPEFLPQLVRVADVFRAWGVKLAIAIDVSSPMRIGGLDTFDPLDPKVSQWWSERFDQIYAKMPDLGGVVVKADSEGRLGPSTYHRTPADSANVIARALKSHGGLVFYRAFVYNHHLDWRDLKNDRAKAAYDNFHPLDGQFDDNVVIQIKHGPIDFQAREPVSPLFGGLEKTNEAIELQITQEYTGQARHLCFLAPMWKEVLDFDMHAARDNTPVKDLVAGKVFHRPVGGYVGIANVGLDANWLAHPLAMANLYAFGRLAWNPDNTPQAIAIEWTQLTFGTDPTVDQTIVGLQLASWRTYENYTGPLGAQTLTDITGSHYGPNIESSEENGWGQWHRADEKGIGMDRTVATGTGFVGQYRPPVAKIFESLATTPDELLLFFHHVPYTYELHSNKTVIQYIYDAHYDGAAEVAEFVDQWKSLQGHIDAQRFNDVLARLEYQAGHAIVWRDAICNYFLKKSGIADAQGRAGHFPNRIEAESMQLEGYASIDVTPWENASGGKDVACKDKQGCSATYKFEGAEGKYTIAILYFDQKNGESKFRVLLNSKVIDHWSANDQLPATKIGADAATRRNIANLALHPGDEIRIEGIPDRDEPAGLDYIEITPQN